MKLYNGLIGQITELLANREAVHYPYTADRTWPENDHHRMLLQKETAYELGAFGKPACNITCVTSDASFFAGDEVVVMGADLQELKEDAPYARITLLLSEDMEGEETENVYQTLQDMDFVKYHVYPKGYMIRTSGQSGREQVRIGKEALKQGMTFEKIGNTFLQHYKAVPGVKQARVIFLTATDVNFKELEKIGFMATEIRNSLSKLREGLPTECSVCDIREICNEVEGLRELHFGTKDRQKRGITIS